MRFAEWDNPKTGNFEWLIRKAGCMHCEDPGCLKACPAPGAIVQYANGIVNYIQENCIGCGYCVKGCPFNVPRVSQDEAGRVQMHALLRQGRRWQAAGLRKACPTQRHRVRNRRRRCSPMRRRGSPISSRAASSMRGFTIRKAWAART